MMTPRDTLKKPGRRRVRELEPESCACTPAVRVVARPPEHDVHAFYGYVVVVTVQSHRGACPLADEVVHASAVRLDEVRTRASRRARTPAVHLLGVNDPQEPSAA